MQPAAASDRDRHVWQVLSAVSDPEIPVISIVDLGIVRNVQWQDDPGTPTVVVTPTYSGCPATEVIIDSIRSALAAEGFADARVRIQLSPAWTTDWLSTNGRKKLHEYGIAPPVGRAADEQVVDIRQLLRQPAAPAVNCPRCGSRETQVVSAFGSTPCKALYRCLSCREPFDYFKCH